MINVCRMDTGKNIHKYGLLWGQKTYCTHTVQVRLSPRKSMVGATIDLCRLLQRVCTFDTIFMDRVCTLDWIFFPVGGSKRGGI